MKRNLFILGGFVILDFIIVTVIFLNNHQNMTNTAPPSTPLAYPQLEFNIPISIANNNLEVAIANTDAARQRGLSGQPSLTDNQGMLFDFKNSQRDKPGFWMKDMLIPLDIIWIRDNTVVDISRDIPVPPAGANLSDLPRYFPAEPIDTVVEVAAGWCQRHGVTIGAEFKLR